MKVNTPVASPRLIQHLPPRRIDNAKSDDFQYKAHGSMGQLCTEQKSTCDELKATLENECKEAAVNFVQRQNYLAREFVIKYEPRRTGNIVVYENNNVEKRRIAYIGHNNWSSSVVLPASAGIDIYTDGAGICPILIMNLVNKNGTHYIFLSHVYYKDIDAQIDNIVKNLKAKYTTPKEIIFAPQTDSSCPNSKSALSKFLDREIQYICRKMAGRSFVSNKGWAILQGRGQFHTGLWEEDDQSSESINLDNNTVIIPAPIKFMELSLHNSFYNCHFIAFNNDYSLALASSPYGFQLWDVRKKEPIKMLTKETAPTLGLAFSDTKALLAFRDGRILSFDTKTGSEQLILKTSAPIKVAAFSGDTKKLLLVLSRYNIVQIIDLETGKVQKDFNLPSSYNYILSVALSHNGTKALISELAGVSIWDVENGTELKTFKPYSDFVAFNRDDSRILTMSNPDEEIKIRDINTLEELQYIPINTANISSVTFTSNNEKVLVSRSNGLVELYSPISM